MKKLFKTQKLQQGFTFLESLLALFVLSFGLLGVAGMHARSMQTGFVASQRMAAVSKGEELLERIRSNPGGRADYANAPNNNGCATGNDGSVTCSTAEMAADDLFIWEKEVTNVFAPATVSTNVLIETINDPLLDPLGELRIVTITIDWQIRNVNYNYTTVAEVGP